MKIWIVVWILSGINLVPFSDKDIAIDFSKTQSSASVFEVSVSSYTCGVIHSYRRIAENEEAK